jgi:hypothetical protein
LGYTYCFDVRAQDNAGNTSGWSAARCTALPLRSDQLSYSANWTKRSDAGMFGGFAYVTKTHGAKMTRTGIVAERLSLVTTKCESCGTVEVRWNGTVVKTFNLYSRTTVRKQVLGNTSFATAQTGTRTVTNTSATGKAIYIEGVAVYNTH